MKNSRDLINFLFEESQRPELDECLSVFEELDEQEPLTAKRTPLKAALKELGVEAELIDDPEGLCLAFSDDGEYRSARAALKDPEAMVKLAELGWVLTTLGDVAMSGEEPELRLRFLDIALPEPENKEKPGKSDLKDISKAAVEFSYAPRKQEPDLKQAKTKLAAIKPPGEVPHAIKDSAERASRLVAALLGEDL